ncbi:unnamed protein product [Phytophthora lilii]|uniref:Unnamed protein product n=1 Tax=Phytophthora lilii TaxID=2077276 RepID=A0A9W6WX21_9STRA|nr:unnamed protein product [Phytophthora lilii]
MKNFFRRVEKWRSVQLPSYPSNTWDPFETIELRSLTPNSCHISLSKILLPSPSKHSSQAQKPTTCDAAQRLTRPSLPPHKLPLCAPHHPPSTHPVPVTVPYGDPQWPTEAWGYPLGMHCRHLRQLKAKENRTPFFAVDDLEAIGFPWDIRQYKWDLLVMPALRTYREIYGNCDVITTFEVPTGDERWPKLLWGFRLGQTVMSIRYVDTYKAQREGCEEELEELGFSSLSWRRRMWDVKIYPALKAFAEHYGHCNVNFNFVVPKNPNWPKPSWGLRLGATVANMRCRGNYLEMVERDQDKLEELGFVWNPEDDRWTHRIMPGLETYRKLTGVAWVPVDFVVPDEDPWPDLCRGLRLGNVFMKIRHTKAYASYVERDSKRLEELGYNFYAPYDDVAKSQY